MVTLKTIYIFLALNLVSIFVFSKEIIIIGSGVSGLSAADSLKNSGHSITILESRNRIGGRINSDYSFGYALDLGACWIHGISGNEVYALANNNTVKTQTFNYENINFYSQTMSKNDLQDASSKLNDNWVKFKAYLKDYNKNNEKDISIGQALETYIKSNSLSTTELTYLKNYIVSEIENEYGNEIKNLSVFYYDSSAKVVGDDVLMPDGYIKIFEPLANGLNIKKETVVSSIKVSGDKINVETNKGNFQADYVIVTVPLGILKSNKISFSPDLSQTKKNAIEKMSFGTLEKFIVEFTEVFWDNYNLLRILNYPVTPFNWFVNFYKVAGKKTLIFLIGGNAEGLDIYNTPKAKLEEMIVNLMKSIFPNKSILISKSIITNWKNDPFALGSYSSYGVGADPSMVKELAKREGNIFFAGEHTDQDNLQTVRGAYLSGKRVAKEILDLPDSSKSSSDGFINMKKIFIIIPMLIYFLF